MLLLLTPATAAIQTFPAGGVTVDRLSRVEVLFDEPVQGVTAGDLLVNGQAAVEVTPVTTQLFRFQVAPPAGGRVQFRWSPDHGITGVSGVGFALAGAGWEVTVDAAMARESMILSEFMASNKQTLFDDDCDGPDWIELHNRGAVAVNLRGWFLTDDALDSHKWRFPETFIPPGGYLVVFASRKNRVDQSGKFAAACQSRTNKLSGLHTNFGLNKRGEYLALVAPDGEVVSDFGPSFPPQVRDVSFGRVGDGAGATGYCQKPTPGAANSELGSGFAPPVAFSHSSGTFLRSFALNVTAASPAATLRYTLDGSPVGEDSPALGAPLTISNTVQVRVRAFQAGLLPGPPAGETFLLLTNSPAQLESLTSSLPVIVFTTLKPAVIGTVRDTTVHLTLYEPQNGLTRLRHQPILSTRAGLRERGSDLQPVGLVRLGLELRDEFDLDRKLPLLDLPAASEWILAPPSGFDPTMIHNSLTMELSRQMGSPAPRTRFVEVYLNRGGPLASNQWIGVHLLMEKPGLALEGIEEKPARPEDVAAPAVTGGYLLKTDRLDPVEIGISTGGSRSGFVEPKESVLRSEQRKPQVAYLTGYFQALDAALAPENPLRRDPEFGYRAYIDLENWMDFHLLETLSGQPNAIRLDTHFYKPRLGQLRYGPRGRYDRGWESKDDSRDDNPRVWDTGGGLFGAPWWNKLLQDVDAWQVWLDRWGHHRRGPLALTNIFGVIDRMTNEVGSIQPREAQRWSETRPRLSYANEIRIMKTWISNRITWIDGQIARPPRLSSGDATVPPGFQLSLSAGEAVSDPTTVSIYYTLDGTDPRPPGGALAPGGRWYAGPITITANSRVVARAYDAGRRQLNGPPVSSSWSAPVSATLVVTPLPLQLTEILYHPAAPPANSSWSADDFEFLELRNSGSGPLNLTGCRFTSGIRFSFGPASAVTTLETGARVLVVRNRSAFLSRYPGIQNIAGEFEGHLDDDGERVALEGPLGEPGFALSYRGNWVPLANGAGFSLVPRDESMPGGGVGAALAWRASAAEGGSPGQLDPAPASVARVLVNEVLAVPLPAGEGGIELFNPNPNPVDASGWWLSDRLDDPRRHRIGEGAVLQAGGYRVIRESEFGSGPTGFALGRAGGIVWLFSADSEGRLTGMVHDLAFGPSGPGTSYGRRTGGEGRDSAVAQAQVTLGLPNGGPRVGPVVLSEIAWLRSASGTAAGVRDEFLELRNLSGQPVLLFDPSEPGLTWRLDGDASFVFPPGRVLPAEGVLIVVHFDPVLDPFELAGFRALHGVDPSVPILGPWRGSPNPAGGALRLVAPASRGSSDGEPRPYYLVEEVEFSLAPPWPADGLGPGRALVRRSLAEFGNEGANWLGGRPTPGDDDLDHDGLGDRWELANGLNPASALGKDGAEGDPDGDGFSNQLEARNRTLPRDAGSAVRLAAYRASRNQLTLILAVPAGRGFRVEMGDGVTGSPWQALDPATAVGEGTQLFVAAVAEDGSRYFRVREF